MQKNVLILLLTGAEYQLSQLLVFLSFSKKGYHNFLELLSMDCYLYTDVTLEMWSNWFSGKVFEYDWVISYDAKEEKREIMIVT